MGAPPAVPHRHQFVNLLSVQAIELDRLRAWRRRIRSAQTAIGLAIGLATLLVAISSATMANPRGVRYNLVFLAIAFIVLGVAELRVRRINSLTRRISDKADIFELRKTELIEQADWLDGEQAALLSMNPSRADREALYGYLCHARSLLKRRQADDDNSLIDDYSNVIEELAQLRAQLEAAALRRQIALG